MFRKSSIALLAGAALALLAAATPARAVLTLTPDGITDGFTLTTFVSGYSFGASYGPLAQGIAPDGNVITGSLGDRKIYVFHDVDGQTLGSAVSATPYTLATFNPNYAMTTAGGQVYGAQLFGGVYEHFLSDGSHSPIAGLGSIRNNLGMWGNPVNGHIIAAASLGLLVDIDPVAGTFRTIASNVFPDGVSVSPTGTIAYVAVPDAIRAYDIASGVLLHIYSGNGHGPDGTGVISGGRFNGFIIVNNNDGTVGLIDPTLGTETIIASLGTRGDFVSPDTSNGTLFLSQNERVDRLSCGPDCTFVGPPPPPPGVPEPASLALVGSALVALGIIRGRKSVRTLCSRLSR